MCIGRQYGRRVFITTAWCGWKQCLTLDSRHSSPIPSVEKSSVTVDVMESLGGDGIESVRFHSTRRQISPVRSIHLWSKEFPIIEVTFIVWCRCWYLFIWFERNFVIVVGEKRSRFVSFLSFRATELTRSKGEEIFRIRWLKEKRSPMEKFDHVKRKVVGCSFRLGYTVLSSLNSFRKRKKQMALVDFSIRTRLFASSSDVDHAHAKRS